jgi:hypothetical protein
MPGGFSVAIRLIRLKKDLLPPRIARESSESCKADGCLQGTGWKIAAVLPEWFRSIVFPSRIETIDIDWSAVSSNRIFPKSREADLSQGYVFFLS